MDSNISPATVLSETDHGDDMQLRVRYQSTYGAFVALGMLIDDTEIDAVYCEHHEDVLIRKKNGKFHGCQVKTRAAKLGPFKADDSQIKAALSRFLALEIAFPASFERFTIASNVAFWDAEENSKSLPFIIELARSNPGKAPSTSLEIRRLVSGLRENHKCKVVKVWEVLARVTLQGELPQFNDIECQLAVEIAEVLGARSRRFDELRAAAKALVQLVSDASSLNHTSPLFRYFVFLTEPQDSKEAAIIEVKRISRDQLLEVMRHAFDGHTLLTSGNRIEVSELPSGATKLEKKMAVGGIASAEIGLIKDFKFSTDKLLQEWRYKYGPERAAERYDHLQLLVKEDCFAASAEAKSATSLYGTAMLARVRETLRATASLPATQVARLGVSHHILLGIAGILTEECSLWWSDEFKVDEELAQ